MDTQTFLCGAAIGVSGSSAAFTVIAHSYPGASHFDAVSLLALGLAVLAVALAAWALLERKTFR